METTERYHRLFARYLAGDITPAEKRALFTFLAKRSNRELVTAWLRERSSSSGLPAADSPEYLAARRIADRAGQRLLARVPVVDVPVGASRLKVFRLSRIGWAAASVLLVMGGWLLYGRMHVTTEASSAPIATIPPIEDGDALLKRRDGHTVRLSAKAEGVVSDRSGVRYADGTAVVESEQVTGLPERYDLITPRGGTYQVTLADGSRVHLNAGSRLTYPAYFDGNERKVVLEGEAFFEINKVERGGRHVPFLVEARGKTVEVLGTSFSVSAYADEQVVKATLVTGKIRMGAGGAPPVELLPGQAASSVFGRSHIAIESIDTAMAIAWRRGEFSFEDQPLATIFRTLARWYPISVDYATVPYTRYSGVIGRDTPLDEVLAMLEKTGNVSIAKSGDSLVVKPRRKF